MHPVASLIAEHARKHHGLLVPLLLVVLGPVAHVHGPVQHQLLVASVSWALIWIPTVVRAGIWSGSGGPKRTAGWAAGGLLALSQICDRAACDKEGIWSTKGLLPLLVILLSENELLSTYLPLPKYAPSSDSPTDGSHNPEQPPDWSFTLLAITTVSAGVILATTFAVSPTVALGISSVIFAAIGLVLFGSALSTAKDDGHTGRRGLMSANGTFSRSHSADTTRKEDRLVALRDVAASMAIICAIATYLIEPPISSSAISWEPVYRELAGDWKTLHYHRTVHRVLWMICVNALVNVLMFVTLLQQGAVNTSFLSLFSYICARLNLATTFPGIWFTIVYGSAALLYSFGFSSSTSFLDMRSSVRFRRILIGVTVISLGLLLVRPAPRPPHHALGRNDPSVFFPSPPESPFAPVPMDLKKGHPAAQLIDTAEKEFQDLLNRQSKTLGQAVQEYRGRHGIAPPPNFDKWYEFATRNGVALIDEYDTITQSLMPFWAVKPATIRKRIRDALGHEDTALVAMTIRDGNVVKVENGQEWQQQATTGMMKSFVQYLPDMDLGFNIHDEPRVVVPNDQLSAMIATARDEVLPRAMGVQSPRNAFSSRPSDMNDGKRFEESKTTRFNRFAHQQTWTHSRLSCPSTSQAQKYEDQVPDNLTAYAAAPLNYIYNHTAFSDICNSPSLSSSFGFFERPNAFNIIHELTPIFSQSKISSFQDILYPSPWYWFGKVGYDDNKDTTWENKTNSLYWRGSTTGGFSRNGGWRRQHRQRIVRRLNAPDKANILVPNNGDSTHPSYSVVETDRKAHTSLINVKFSHVGQCDPGDCDAQREFFEVVDRVDGQDAWYYKHLLDIDGNAFSGRFYAFLRSRSLTYKMAMFREWHQEWLRPWVHYVPMSLNGDEHLDLVRWFGGETDAKGGEDMIKEGKKEATKGGNGDSLGERKAREIAERSREWAGKVLRNVDFEAWFFRLLLEYGRVIDDERESIGYPGP